MRPFSGRRILLGVTGGIASYKTVSLARLLAQAGADVDVVMTRSAREFVGAVTFEALTARPVHVDLIADGHALDHIALAKQNEVIVVAPATADFISRAAAGRADDLLTACLLANASPVLIVPAMNDRMWSHPQTVANVAHLRRLGYAVLEPGTGPLASPDEGAGQGRMREPEEILAAVARFLEPAGALSGKRVVVTAGPTREPIDPVRFISNRSSGKMGVAIARAAKRRGAEVTLIAGPLEVPVPEGVSVIRVERTSEMADAVRAALVGANLLVMAAAPADFRPRAVAGAKLKKSAGLAPIALEQTDDILNSTRDARPKGCVVVGFALETNDILANAAAKLESKGLDFIVANDATETGAGFGGDTNRVTILTKTTKPETLPLMSKDAVADAILDRVELLWKDGASGR
ncbi:MAG: bifunctional phosphopantothenoylcysteine decarboxylase/phosphopantothenate--cysteine ligase CoaBC [Gemmatimonadetes bacterium]|nr:bifunctional phosphopantothenoylcysteine decarboxylase/phosphopantothenate--cysteine ligase CoaBC [Gemmatimonadota bacterium]